MGLDYCTCVKCDSAFVFQQKGTFCCYNCHKDWCFACVDEYGGPIYYHGKEFCSICCDYIHDEDVIVEEKKLYEFILKEYEINEEELVKIYLKRKRGELNVQALYCNDCETEECTELWNNSHVILSNAYEEKVESHGVCCNCCDEKEKCTYCLKNKKKK